MAKRQSRIWASGGMYLILNTCDHINGRAWGQEEKGTTEDEMAGWHHHLDGHEFE